MQTSPKTGLLSYFDGFGQNYTGVIMLNIRGIPIGFGYALVKEPDALRNFAILSDGQRSIIIERAKKASDKTELNRLIDVLATGRTETIL